MAWRVVKGSIILMTLTTAAFAGDQAVCASSLRSQPTGRQMTPVFQREFSPAFRYSAQIRIQIVSFHKSLCSKIPVQVFPTHTLHSDVVTEYMLDRSTP